MSENRSQPRVWKEAQKILIQCGAVRHCIEQWLGRDQIVRKIFRAPVLIRPLDGWLLRRAGLVGCNQPHLPRFGDGGGAIMYIQFNVGIGKQVADGGIAHV